MSKSSRLKVTAAIAQMSPEVDVIAEAAVDQEGQTFLLVILSSFPRWISSASKVVTRPEMKLFFVCFLP